MILKIGHKMPDNDVEWNYWDKVDNVTCKRGMIKQIIPNREVGIVYEQSDGYYVNCTRFILSEAVTDKKGNPVPGNQVRVLTVSWRDRIDAEVIATDYTNNVFLCNDEGKTIDRL